MTLSPISCSLVHSVQMSTKCSSQQILLKQLVVYDLKIMLLMLRKWQETKKTDSFIAPYVGECPHQYEN